MQTSATETPMKLPKMLDQPPTYNWDFPAINLISLPYLTLEIHQQMGGLAKISWVVTIKKQIRHNKKNIIVHIRFQPAHIGR
jgi:hypothetical protein